MMLSYRNLKDLMNQTYLKILSKYDNRCVSLVPLLKLVSLDLFQLNEIGTSPIGNFLNISEIS